MELVSHIRLVRARLMRFIKPGDSYWVATKSLQPLSGKFGFDRGTPIDRYWIESFLKENASHIKGRCLEITDNTYTVRFGGSKVTKSDVLDINPKNKRANIHGDLRNLKKVKTNTYDCVILTQVLGMIDDFDAVIRECHRILMKGGSILVTSSTVSPTYTPEYSYWRFTPNGLKFAFGKYFDKRHLKVSSHGNVLAGQCFWVGMSQEDLTEEQIKYNDPYFACVSTLIGIKT